MKYIFIVTLLFSSLYGFTQDSMLIASHPLINKEQRICISSNNKLECLDSLIIRYKKGLDYPEEDHVQFYKKLTIYHINAAGIAFMRGNVDQSLQYLNNAEQYVDSISVLYEKDQDAQNIAGSFRNIQMQFCYQTYQRDTSVFYNWNCDRLFPELNQKIRTSADSISITNSAEKINTENNHWGEFYLNDTLRFNRQFVSDSISIKYFNQIKSQILSKLSYKSFPEMIREPGFNMRTDTLIIQVSINTSSNEIIRKCSVSYENCISLISEHYLHLFSNMDFPDTKGNVLFYIPIILTPESPNNYNRMDRTTINDDHFLIEYEKLKPIELH